MHRMGKTKAIYSELVIARESVTVTCVLAETQSQEEEWESFIGIKREAPGVPLSKAIVLGKLEVAN